MVIITTRKDALFYWGYVGYVLVSHTLWSMGYHTTFSTVKKSVQIHFSRFSPVAVVSVGIVLHSSIESIKWHLFALTVKGITFGISDNLQTFSMMVCHTFGLKLAYAASKSWFCSGVSRTAKALSMILCIYTLSAVCLLMQLAMGPIFETGPKQPITLSIRSDPTIMRLLFADIIFTNTA